MAVATAQEYVNQLKALLPPGPAFPRGDSTSLFAMMLEVWGAELARVDGRACQVIEEADPRQAIETFQEWLDQWGLPDECIKLWSQNSNSMLRALLLWKIKDTGSPNLAFFRDLAAMFGYTITIDEFFRHSVRSRSSEVLASERWPNTWRVNVCSGLGAKVTYHQVTGGAEEALAWWGDAIIECLIKRYAPAHTKIYFGYYE